jgi:MFS family permease
MIEVAGKKKIHHGIWVFVGCCFISAFFFALSASIVSVFILYASAGVNAGPGDWAFNSTIGSVAGMICSPFLGRWLQGGKFKIVAMFSLVCLCAKFYGIALATTLWQVYVLGFIAGVAMPVLMTMTIPNLIGNWFAPKQRGKFMGFATAFTAVGTFVWAPVFAVIVNAVGYRMAYAIDATLILVAVAPWILFVFKFKPEEMGLQPYGYDPNDAEEQGNVALERGASVTSTLKMPIFWVILITMMITTICMGFSSYQSGIAREALVPTGFTVEAAAVIAGTMVSTIAVANFTSKLVFGFLLDKFGNRVAINFFAVMLIAAFCVYLFAHQWIVALYIAAFLLGTHNCLVSVAFPLTVRSLFGNRDYAKIYAFCCVGTGLSSSFGVATIGWVYQWTGTYFAPCWYGLAVGIVMTILVNICISRIGKVKWDLGPDSTPKVEAATN